MRRLYPDAEYRIYSGNDIRDFIINNFEERVINSYDTLKPFAYKCDLARLCLLYVYGGLYVDLGIRIFFDLQISEKTEILLFRCPLHRENHPWDVENSVMFSAPKREEFKVAIDIICDNVEKLFYGVNTLAPTGPGVIGRAIAIVGAEEDYAIGFSSVSNTELPVHFFNYILPNGTFVATRTKNGRLSVVIEGANDYNDFWHAKIVYGEPTIFLAEHFRSGITDGKAAGKKFAKTGLSVAGSGTVIWGPYRFLMAGRYVATMSFSKNTNINGLKVDFFDIGIGVLYEIDLEDAEKVSDTEYRFEFDNLHTSRLLEARFHSNGKSRGELLSVKLDPVDDRILQTVFLARDFYSEKTEGKRAGKAGSRAGIPFDGVGCVVWGPYRFLREGRYKVSVLFRDSTSTDGLKVELFDKGLGHLHKQKLTSAERVSNREFSFEFTNRYTSRNFEVRLVSSKSTKGALVSVVFEPIPLTEEDLDDKIWHDRKSRKARNSWLKNMKKALLLDR